MMKSVRKHVTEKWVLLYIERWLKAPVQIAEDPLACVALGTGKALENEELFSTMLSEY